MNSKLTLKMSDKVIKRAKRYAKKNKQSLSALVENYFSIISKEEDIHDIEISPNVLELSGIIKLPEDFDIKREYRKHLEEKYSR